MPRLPGRESTRKTIALEQATIASFQMPWEDRVAKKQCCIEGCTHRCSGRTDGGTDFKQFEPCARNNAAVIYDESLMPGPTPDPYVGFACPCCVDKILADESAHGT